MTAVTAAHVDVIEHLDPATLVLDVNVRKDARLDPDFLASIKELGVLEPVVATRTPDGQVRVRLGQRRTLAAAQVARPTIPVWVVADEATATADDVARIVAQHAENHHRAALTVTEDAAVVQALFDAGLTAGEITARTRIRPEDVAAAAAVARSERAAAAAAKHDWLTLDQAAGLAEFDDDEEATAKLLRAADHGPGEFPHQLQRLRDQKAEQAELAAARGALEANGVTVLDERPEWFQNLVQLRDADGVQLEVEAHRACPGHAAVVERSYRDGAVVARVLWYCTDPVANGHQLPNLATPAKPKPAGEEAAAERRRVIDNNRAWRSSEKVRRAWLKNVLLRRKTPPAGAVRYIVGELARGDHELRRALEQSHKLARELLGMEAGEGQHGAEALAPLYQSISTAPSDGRALVIGLGLILCAHEAATGVHTWRTDDPAWRTGIQAGARRYFAALDSWGYGLSEVERLVLAPRPATKEA